MLEDPLANLKDIHLPEVGSWWPPAPGWWVLAGLLLLAPLLWRALATWRKRTHAPRYHSAAQLELEQHYQHLRQHHDTPAFVQAVSALLKRVAMQCYPAQQVASLSGAQWADFLGQEQDAATRAVIKAALVQVHSKQVDVNTGAFYHFARQWIDTRGEF